MTALPEWGYKATKLLNRFVFKENVMASVIPLAKIWGEWIHWWQIVLLLVMIALIVFWTMYRRKQM